MIYTGTWETVGDPKERTERQAVPDGWIVRVRAVNTGKLGTGTKYETNVGVSVTFVPDKGHHWKIEKPKEAS